MFTESLNSNVKLSVYVGDEDSTTAAHIKEKVPYPVEKWTDTVHAKRSLTTRLLCTLNIPPMNPVTFKSRENEPQH